MKIEPYLDANEQLAESPLEGEPAECFIQWKNTDVCFDFRCDCGAEGHFDGYFAYQMPAHVYPRRIEKPAYHRPVTPETNEPPW